MRRALAILLLLGGGCAAPPHAAPPPARYFEELQATRRRADLLEARYLAADSQLALVKAREEARVLAASTVPEPPPAPRPERPPADRLILDGNAIFAHGAAL